MTIEQLAVKVLSKLGVYDQSVISAADLANVSDAYNGVYYALNDDGLVTWAFADDIPTRFTLPVINLVAAEIADFYKVTAPPEGWERVKLYATNKIRRQLATGQDPEPVAPEWF